MDAHSKHLTGPFWFAALALALAGCSNSPLIGERPSDPPPQVVSLGARDAQGQEYLTWKRIAAFGRVPAGLQAAGDISCMRVGIQLRAVGYHPHALDRAGNPMPAGGYFCEPGLPGSGGPPPRIVLRDGKPGWDRPGAFDSVPDSELQRGKSECEQAKPTSYPLAYHRRAVDLSGAPFLQGGFLCVE